MSAKAPDQWPDILVDPHLTEDRYIKGVQIVPTKGFPVIHHIRTSIVEPSDGSLNSGKLDSTDGSLEVGEQGVFLNEYAIGKKGDVFPEGSGRLIKAGTKINFQLHLHSIGQGNPTNVALGLKFYPRAMFRITSFLQRRSVRHRSTSVLTRTISVPMDISR